MVQSALRPGGRFQSGGIAYEVLHLRSNGVVVTMNLGTMTERIWTIEEIVSEQTSGALRFELPGRVAEKPTQGDSFSTSSRYPEFSLYPEEDKELARTWKAVLDQVMRLRPNERTDRLLDRYANYVFLRRLAQSGLSVDEQRSLAAARAAGKRVPNRLAISRSSIRRKLSQLNQGGDDIRALVDKSHLAGAPDESRLPPWVEQLLQASLKTDYKKTPRPRVWDAYVVFKTTFNAELPYSPDPDASLPSYETYLRRANALDPKERDISREGKTTAANRHRVTQTRKSPDFPYERLEMDGADLNLLVVDPTYGLPLGRAKVMATRESLTASPGGFAVDLEDESWASASECIYHSILPKPEAQEIYGTQFAWSAYGRFDMLVGDNAWWNAKSSMDDAAHQLRFTIDRNAPRSPWLKGGIEAFMKSIQTDVVHHGEGTTFGSILSRGEYDAMGRACVTMDRLTEILYIYFVDIYAQTPHGKRKGTPAELWQSAMERGHYPGLYENAEMLKVLLGRVDFRVPNHYGIDYQCIRYQDTGALGPIRSQLMNYSKKAEISDLDRRLGKTRVNELKFKWDPRNLGKIHVFDHVISQQYIEVSAVGDDAEYADGLSVWAHRKIQAYVKKVMKIDEEVRITHLLEAKARIREIFQSEFEVTKTVRARNQAHRILKDTGGMVTSYVGDISKNSYAGMSIGGVPKEEIDVAWAEDPDSSGDYSADYGIRSKPYVENHG